MWRFFPSIPSRGCNPTFQHPAQGQPAPNLISEEVIGGGGVVLSCGNLNELEEKIKERFKGGHMGHPIGQDKFCAKPDSQGNDRSKRKAYEWVAKFQILAVFIICFQGMYYANMTEGWKGYSVNAGVTMVFYFLISGVLDRITRHIEVRDNEIRDFRRQLVGFVCDASLGRVPESDLKRIASAANNFSWRSSQKDLSKDDFNLISRAWFFWKDQNGFEWQDETECMNCTKLRRDHERDGTCPELLKDNIKY